MVRTLTVVIGLAMSLLGARDASAIPITPVDLDSWVPGSLVRSHYAAFNVNQPPPMFVGSLTSDVFFDGTQYTYVHTVRPTTNSNFLFHTWFLLFDNQTPIRGFNSIAGWSFSDAFLAGGTGTDSDFNLNVDVSGQLHWRTSFATEEQPFARWDALNPISFFFVSVQPPGYFKNDYGLFTSGFIREFSTASSLAPVPEPGSIALFGSGLVGLYAAVRRRRSQNE